MKSTLSCLLLLLQLTSLPGEAADQRQTMKLEKEEQFRDFFLLTSANFAEAVEQSRMAWVVFFHGGMLERSWKTSAASLRGVVRFGMVHRTEEDRLLRKLKLAKGTVARVYPYGGKIVKKKYLEDCPNAMDAVSNAEQSIPNRIIELQKGGGLQGFLMDSFTSSPTRLPVLILTRDSSPAPMFRALALRFERFFNFRLVRDPSAAKMRSLGLPSDFFYHVPGMVVLILENFEKPAQRNFFAVQFDKAKMGGELNYANGLMFLLQMNARFRHTLPGDNGAKERALVRAEEVLKEERQVFDIREEHLSLDPHVRSAAPLEPQRSKQEL